MIDCSLESFNLLLIFTRFVGRVEHNRYNTNVFPHRKHLPHSPEQTSMIHKIVLSNFMAHAQSELQLADGLTVLVGPNNIGKSTFALALKILARNANSSFVLQHDQKNLCSFTCDGRTVLVGGSPYLYPIPDVFMLCPDNLQNEFGKPTGEMNGQTSTNLDATGGDLE